MFGKPNQNRPNTPQPQRAKASDIAHIQGSGLVQAVVTSVNPLIYYVFLNDQNVPQMEIESLSISVEAPVGNNPNDTIVRATLNRYVKNVTGEIVQQSQELFPSTVEIVALNRRLSITCMNRDSVEGLWVSLGLKTDGTSSDLNGLMSVRFLLSEGFLDGKITWADNGETEDIFPTSN